MSVLKKSTLSLLCAGLLMSSCSSQCGLVSLLGWIATGSGATLTALSAWFYKSSNQRRLNNKALLANHTCDFGGGCDHYRCPKNDSCKSNNCYRSGCIKYQHMTDHKKTCGDCLQDKTDYNNKIKDNQFLMKLGKYGMYAGGTLAVGGLAYLLIKSRKRVEV